LYFASVFAASMHTARHETTNRKAKHKMQNTPTTRGEGDTASPSATTPGLGSETWVRLPANGGRLEGLSRAALYRIVADKASGVVSVAICQPGSDRGVRLIGLQSLRTYIAKCAENQIAARLAEKEAA
jgi:hypothetical protein